MCGQTAGVFPYSAASCGIIFLINSLQHALRAPEQKPSQTTSIMRVTGFHGNRIRDTLLSYRLMGDTHRSFVLSILLLLLLQLLLLTMMMTTTWRCAMCQIGVNRKRTKYCRAVSVCLAGCLSRSCIMSKRLKIQP